MQREIPGRALAARAWAWSVEHPPPGPFRPGWFRSPLRGPWLTSFAGLVLLVGIPVVFLTGLLSYAAYDPRLGGPGNDPTPRKGILGFYLFTWPAHPAWLYRVNQGVHVTVGLMLIPFVLLKLWSALPRLFAWPPITTAAHAVERISLLFLVGGIGFELVTGVLNAQNAYFFPFSFYTAHLYGAWVFFAAFAVHVVLRLGRMLHGLRRLSFAGVMRTTTQDTLPEPPDEDGLVAAHPSKPTTSRRAVLGLATGGALTLAALQAGQWVGGPLRRIALLSPRGGDVSGSEHFQVNTTFLTSRIDRSEVADTWRLTVTDGAETVQLSRAQLAAMPHRVASLPIACVEGWSSGDRRWEGVALRDLADLVGGRNPLHYSQVESLQRHGEFRSVRLAPNQTLDPDTLLALRVDGADLTLDHGYPARVIVPAAPGVHATKWVSVVRFVRSVP
jgi:DMSO/TMAO reductase YedYZ molybdopterin-dependent catalytic subunit